VASAVAIGAVVDIDFLATCLSFFRPGDRSLVVRDRTQGRAVERNDSDTTSARLVSHGSNPAAI